MTNEPAPLGDALGAAARKSSLSAVASDEMPTGAAIIAAIGGVRGLVESVLPSFLFLVAFLVAPNFVEKDRVVLVSSLVPVAVALIFVIVRVASKLPVAPAISGGVFVAVTAALAIGTDRAENNFVLGLWLNAAYLAAMLVSIVVRRPLIGVVVALLMGERAKLWREQPQRYRLLTRVTWLWAAMFGLRLVIELPMYLAGNAAGLAIAKLILGVPLYALVLWITWILVRSVFPPEVDPADSSQGEEPSGEASKVS